MMWGHFNWLQCHGFIAVQLASLPWAHCRFNWVQCHGFIAIQLASLPQAHCHFSWLNCHGLIAISIGFIATVSLPFLLTSLPRVHCHSIGLITFSWVHCLSNRDTTANPLLTCLPLTKCHWLSIPICLLAPHLSFGTPFAHQRPQIDHIQLPLT
jgi:hypothetical protein